MCNLRSSLLALRLRRIIDHRQYNHATATRNPNAAFKINGFYATSSSFRRLLQYFNLWISVVISRALLVITWHHEESKQQVTVIRLFLSAKLILLTSLSHQFAKRVCWYQCIYSLCIYIGLIPRSTEHLCYARSASTTVEYKYIFLLATHLLVSCKYSFRPWSHTLV